MFTHVSKALAIGLAIAAFGAFTPAMAQKSTGDAAAAKVAPKAGSSSKTAPNSGKAKSAKTASVCKGLTETQCTAKSECGWVKPKKKASTTGQKLSAYCRKAPSKAKKK